MQNTKTKWYNFQKLAVFGKKLDIFLKYLIDFTGALTGLIFAAPLLILIAIAIKLESKGSIFFSQKRVGLNGKLFNMYKFRSMYIDAEERMISLNKNNQHGNKGITFKMKKDPRITKIGKFIRKYSIDELPQLLNILKGNMSIVGPRPALPREVARYNLTSTARLKGKPGLTCLWQISGRSNISFEQQVEMDVDYLTTRTLIKDISIILKTPHAVLTAKGAY